MKAHSKYLDCTLNSLLLASPDTDKAVNDKATYVAKVVSFTKLFHNVVIDKTVQEYLIASSL